MEFLFQFILLLSLLAAYSQYVDALIGLRPPKKSPPKVKKTNKPSQPVSPQPTQLHSPFENLSTPLHNVTHINNDEANSNSSQCHPMPLLRCSYKLLSQSLQNDSSICRQAQQFSQCSKSSLRASGRRDFIIGVGIVEEFIKTIYSKHSCHDNASLSSPEHKRHQQGKRHGSQCCVDGIMNCAVEVFLKMIHNRHRRCPLVDLYELCLQEAKGNCHFNSLRTLYPVFTMRLKRKCKIARVRRKRDFA